MQSASISNALPGNAPIPAVASSPSPGGQPSSPFTALFQMLTKTGNGPAKLPAPGKPKDSARAQDVATPASISLQIVCQFLGAIVSPLVAPVHVPSIPAGGAPLESGPNQDPPAAPSNGPMSTTSILVGAFDNQSSPASSTRMVTPRNLQSSSTSNSVFVTTNELSQAFPFSFAESAPRSSQTPPTPNSVLAATNDPSAPFPFSFAEPTQDVTSASDPAAASSNTQNSSPDLPVQAYNPQMDLGLQMTPSVSVLDANPGPQTQDAVPVQNAPTDSSSVSKAKDPNNTNALQPDSKAAAPNTAGIPHIRALQAESAGLELMNLQVAGGTRQPANPIQQLPQPSALEFTPKLNLNFQTGPVAAIPASPVQTATKTMSVAIPTPTFQDSLHAQAVTGAQAAPAVSATPKLQSKDTSSGSQGNDANAKSDHPSNSALVHTDGNGFGQTLDTAGASAGNTHFVPTDPTMVVANVRIPVEPRTASADAKPDASNADPLPQSQSSPAASAVDHPIVSGARLTDLPGQTEIRIEMQAGSLGAIELRAHITGDQIGASIAVEHHDAQLMLTNDLPALHYRACRKGSPR